MIPIVMITDNNYVIPTITAIQSISDNYKGNEKLLVYIIGVCLNSNMRLLIKAAVYERIDITLMEEDVFFEKGLQKKNQYVTRSALLKFEIPNIMRDYNKVLYIDGDVLVKDDITILLNRDIGNKFAAVVEDMDCVLKRKDNVRVGHKHYFNSGMMLLNCKRLRDDRLSEKMIDIKRNREELHYMDQDVFNIAFEEEVLYLEPKFNFMSGYDFYSLSTINRFFNTFYENTQKMDEDVVVLHLAGICKPWNSHKGNHVGCFTNGFAVGNLRLPFVKVLNLKA